MTRISDMTPLTTLPATGAYVPVEQPGSTVNYRYDLSNIANLNGLFVNATGLTIPVGIDIISTTGYSAEEKGGALYIYDAAVDSTYVAANPRSSFVSANARGFRLSHDQTAVPEMFGVLGTGDDLAALQAFNDWVFASIRSQEIDISGNFGIAGTFYLGPASAPNASFHRWNIRGDMTLRQLTPSVTTTCFIRNLTSKGAADLNVAALGYGIDDNQGTAISWATRSTAGMVGISLDNCSLSNLGSLRGRGFWYAGVDFPSTATHFNDDMAVGVLHGTDCGSGYIGYSLTSAWSAPAQTGSTGSTAQRQTIHVDTLPPVLLDTAGANGTFPQCRVRINGFPYHVYAINRGTNAVTIYPWLDPDSVAAASGTLQWCFGGTAQFSGIDSGIIRVGKLYGSRCGNGGALASLYSAVIESADLIACGTALAIGASPDSASIGTSVDGLYIEGCNEHVVFHSRWGATNAYISSSYSLDPALVFSCADPRKTNGDFDFGGGALGYRGMGSGCATIPVNGRLLRHHSWPIPVEWTTNSNIQDHDRPPAIYTQYCDSQTVAIKTVGFGEYNRLFGYSGATYRFIGTGGGNAPTGSLVFVPPTRDYAACVTTNTSTSVTMASTKGIVAGMPITGTGIPGSTTVASITNSTTIVLSAAATASGTVTLTVTGSINGTFANVTFSGFYGAVDFEANHRDLYEMVWKATPIAGWRLSASATYDPPSIAAGASTTTTIAVTGAAMGDAFVASFSNSLGGLVLTAYVSVGGTVTCVFSNPTAGAVDLASGTLKVAKVA